MSPSILPTRAAVVTAALLLAAASTAGVSAEASPAGSAQTAVTLYVPQTIEMSTDITGEPSFNSNGQFVLRRHEDGGHVVISPVP